MAAPYSNQLSSLTAAIDKVGDRFAAEDLTDPDVATKLEEALASLLLASPYKANALDDFETDFRAGYLRREGELDAAFRRSVENTINLLQGFTWPRSDFEHSYRRDLEYACSASVYVMLAQDERGIPMAESHELFSHAHVTFQRLIRIERNVRNSFNLR